MIPISLVELATIVGGTLAGGTASAAITGFATDNREVKPGDLFLAIRGLRVDGHDFAADAFQRGATAALVEKPVSGPYVLVSNLVEALAEFGRHFRNGFERPVIGITGSAGKTTTKEFLAAALSPLGEVLKTQGNRNTEYTAPLLWAELTADTKAVVMEMAMRGPGQIAHLASFSKPTMGLITNIGHSHMSELGSREGIARAKAELLEALPENGIAILPQEDEFFPLLMEAASGRQIYTFGTTDAADCRVIGYRSEGWTGSVINGFFADIPWSAEIPYVGKHLGLNVASAVCAATALGLSPQEAAEALEGADLPPMRMEVVWHRGAKVLLDAYNASPASMRSALETFAELPAGGRRIAILGQMNELGDESEKAHQEIGEIVKGMDFTQVLTYGPLARGYGLGEPVESIDVLKDLMGKIHGGDAVLIKGSRSLRLEQVLE